MEELIFRIEGLFRLIKIKMLGLLLTFFVFFLEEMRTKFRLSTHNLFILKLNNDLFISDFHLE